MSGMKAFHRMVSSHMSALLAVVCVFLTTGSSRGEEAVDGHFESVQNPITTVTVDQMKNRIDQALNRPGMRVRKVVFDFNPGDGEAATSDYFSCSKLAEYINTLKNNGIQTIAFVHGKTSRHSVLPVLACTDLVMSHDAKIGEVAGPDDNVPQRQRQAQEYAEIAGKSREAVVLKMLDKNVEVVLGTEGANNPIYVDSAKAGKAGTPFEGVFVAKGGDIIVPRGGIGLYNTEQALRFGLCTVTAETREEVAEKYTLTPASLRGDRYGGNKIKAVKIDLTGVIDDPMIQKFKRQLQEVRSKKENTIFLLIDCGGGSAKIARDMFDLIRDLKNDEEDPIWTVAFIPNKSADIATFIAMACSEIVMFKGSDASQEATIGDFESFLGSMSKGGDSSNTVEFLRRNLLDIAEKQGFSKHLVEGMINRDEEIVLVHDQNRPAGAHEIMSRKEFDGEVKEKKRQLRIIKHLKQPGSYLKLNATMAKELRIAQNTVDNRDVKEVYTLYGVDEKSVRDSKPGWLDDFAAFLRRTEVWILLLIIAFAGLILEVKMPGATIPGLVALVCFVLFFWSQAYANGATVYLAIALFVLGLMLLGVEVFILPGFGVTGISGVLLILAGVGLATFEKAPSTTEEWVAFTKRQVTIGFSLVGSGFLAFFFARYLPKIPYVNRLMLAPPSDQPGQDSDSSPLPGAELAAGLLGQVGTATSMLRPAGMARIGDVYTDVVTEGDFIEPGTSIQVVEVEGTRIVVKRV